MTVELSILRKGSLGIEGTYRNANHHAEELLPLINLIEMALKSIGAEVDFKWKQGNNIHIIERTSDGASICLRPFLDHEEWGIDVLAKFSRSVEMRLMTVVNVAEVGTLINFLDYFLSIPDNKYGKSEKGE